MKKSKLTSQEKALTEEIKLLNKEVAQLKSQNKSTEAKLDQGNRTKNKILTFAS